MFWSMHMFAPLTQRGVCWFWSRAFISHQCFISQSLMQRFVCPSTEISSRFCVVRLSSCIKLVYKDQTTCASQSLHVSSSTPSPGLFTKGVSVFSTSLSQRSGRLPSHLNLLSQIQLFSVSKRWSSHVSDCWTTSAVTCSSLQCWRANRFYRLMQDSLLKFHYNPSQQICVFVMKHK